MRGSVSTATTGSVTVTTVLGLSLSPNPGACTALCCQAHQAVTLYTVFFYHLI